MRHPKTEATGAAAGVGDQQAAEHADERGLTAAVRPENPQISPARTCRAMSLTTVRSPNRFGHAPHVDGELVAHREVPAGYRNWTSTGWPGCSFEAVMGTLEAGSISTMKTSLSRRLSRLRKSPAGVCSARGRDVGHMALTNGAGPHAIDQDAYTH